MGTRHRIDRAFIRAISPNGKYQAFQDADLTGFGIKVSPVGTVAYTYRWVKPDGTQGRRNIARWPDLQPGEARELCRREIALLDRKGDSPPSACRTEGTTHCRAEGCRRADHSRVS